MITRIYLITNLNNNKRYIGCTVRSISFRWKEHCRKSSKCILRYAIQQYGSENFSIEEVYASKDHEHTLNTMEEFFIRKFNTHIKDGWGYNGNYGGTHHRGGHSPTSETRRKQSIASKKRSKRPETGAAISAALKGRIINDDWRKKLSEANIGKTASESTRAKMRKPKIFTQETIDKITYRNKTRHGSYKITSPDGDITISTSLLEFAEQNGLIQSGLSRTVNGHQKSYRGYTVERLT